MLGVYGQPAGDLTGGKPFPSLPTGGTIHSRVSEHRGHYHEVIIIHNHAVAEPERPGDTAKSLKETGEQMITLKGGGLGDTGERKEGRGKE